MRHKLFLLSVLPLIVVLALSCKKKDVQDEAQVTFKTYEIKKDHHLKGNEKNPVLSISLNIQFPDTFSNVTVLNKIRKAVLTDFFPDLDKDINDPKIAMDTYIKKYIEFYESSEDVSNDGNKDDDEVQPDVAWWHKEKMAIRYNSDNILSYTVETNLFTGGPHEGKTFLNTVINLKTGDRITEEDLFTEESRPLIAELILKKIMQKYKVENVEDLVQIGFFDITDIDLNKNFYITKEGIVYTYNEFDIASYAVGTTEILLKFPEISEFMIPENPLVPLLL